MTDNTARTLATAMLWASYDLEDGILPTRLCCSCGAVKHPGMECVAAAPVRQNNHAVISNQTRASNAA